MTDLSQRGSVKGLIFQLAAPEVGLTLGYMRVDFPIYTIISLSQVMAEMHVLI